MPPQQPVPMKQHYVAACETGKGLLQNGHGEKRVLHVQHGCVEGPPPCEATATARPAQGHTEQEDIHGRAHRRPRRGPRQCGHAAGHDTAAPACDPRVCARGGLECRERGRACRERAVKVSIVLKSQCRKQYRYIQVLISRKNIQHCTVPKYIHTYRSKDVFFW